jgi:hypothetical protein
MYVDCVRVYAKTYYAPSGFSLMSPADGTPNAGVTPTLTWRQSLGANEYTVAIYSDDQLQNEVHSAVVAHPDAAYEVPASLLDFDAHYWWTVAAHNEVGDTVGTPEAGSAFSTSVPGAPTATTSPADREGGADTGAVITIIFNEPVIVTGPNDVVTVDGVTGDVAATTPFKIVFTPDVDLEFATTYTVRVQPTGSGSSVVDQAVPPNAFNDGDEYVFTFTTWAELGGLASGEGCLPVRAAARTQTGVPGGEVQIAVFALLALCAASLPSPLKQCGGGCREP